MTTSSPRAGGRPAFARRLRGNLTLWFVVGGLAVFKLWRWLSGYPPGALVSFGLIEVAVSTLQSATSAVAGALGLGALLAKSDFVSMLRRLYWPYEAIENRELREVISHPVSVVLAAAFLGLSAYVATTHCAMVVRVDDDQYESVIEIRSSHRATLVSEGTEARHGQARITASQPAKILLAGPSSTSFLLIKDRYGFQTLSAIEVRGGLLGVSVTPADLRLGSNRCVDKLVEVAYPGYQGGLEMGVAAPGLEIRARGYSVEILEQQPWARRLPVRFRALDRAESASYLDVADGSLCPAQDRDERKQGFWEQLCTLRQEVAGWSRLGSYSSSAGHSTSIPVGPFLLELVHGAATVSTPTSTTTTREVCGIFVGTSPGSAARGGKASDSRG